MLTATTNPLPDETVFMIFVRPLTAPDVPNPENDPKAILPNIGSIGTVGNMRKGDSIE